MRHLDPPSEPGETRRDTPSRRRFLQTLAMFAIGGRTLLRSGDARAAIDAVQRMAQVDLEWPAMTYRTLGRTGFRGSRLVFGCGAALSRRRRDDLLDAAFDAGINVFDVGFRGYYGDAEAHLAPFLKRRRDAVFLISKAIPLRDVEPDQTLSGSQHREAAKAWSRQLDDSLRELRVDAVDAYYTMAANNVDLVKSEELLASFENAKRAGKVKHLGLSTHQNAEAVLMAAASTDRYDLATIAITPAGWYDWKEKAILADTKPMAALRPTLAAAREAGMALIGMKAGRYLAGRRFLGRAKPKAFDAHYGAAVLRSGLNAFQRSYAYVLAHGLDAVNADMQTLPHLHENTVAATQSETLFASR